MIKIKCDIVILDSGISLRAYEKYRSQIVGFRSFLEDNQSYVDCVGHGTAIANAILKDNAGSMAYLVKIFDAQLEVDESILLEALNHVYQDVDCRVVHMSLGIVQCEEKERLHALIRALADKGVLIVSAFDNMGALSYPAAFPSVIGVDTAQTCRKTRDYIVVRNSNVDICGYGGMQRVSWLDDVPFAFVSGTSFAAANITSIIMQTLSGKVHDKAWLMRALESEAVAIWDNSAPNESMTRLSIGKAIALPLNKEIYSLVNYADALPFALVGLYDYRQGGSVNKPFSSIYGDREYTVGDIDRIDWGEDFDTVIIGHLDHWAMSLKRDLLKELVEKAVIHGKQIYSFDTLAPFAAELTAVNQYYPHIGKEVVANNYGKMAMLNTPVLGVFGTSSQQGKFTVQLYLRKKFIENEYSVAQMGTEPSAFLFGMDSIFPMGYNSSIELNFRESLCYLNREMMRMEDSGADIILVGSQSNTSLYWPGNISQYPSRQVEFLMGTLPDAVVLCVNPFDDVAYIQKTIQVIESLSFAKVIAMALFPFSSEDETYLLSQRTRLTSEAETSAKRELINALMTPHVYVIGNITEMDALYARCASWFVAGGGDSE